MTLFSASARPAVWAAIDPSRTGAPPIDDWVGYAALGPGDVHPGRRQHLHRRRPSRSRMGQWVEPATPWAGRPSTTSPTTSPPCSRRSAPGAGSRSATSTPHPTTAGQCRARSSPHCSSTTTPARRGALAAARSRQLLGRGRRAFPASVPGPTRSRPAARFGARPGAGGAMSGPDRIDLRERIAVESSRSPAAQPGPAGSAPGPGADRPALAADVAAGLGPGACRELRGPMVAPRPRHRRGRTRPRRPV